MTAATDTIHVLHVDDEPGFAETVAEFLEREDGRIDVRTATDAEEGLALLADHGTDCVVSDHDMPGRTGIEFLEAVREDHPDLPFVLYTGKGSEAVASDAISAGVSGYLQKETTTEQYAVLANRIVTLVEARRAERERERHLDAIEAAQEGISILDEDGEFLYVNRTYADLYGYTPDEMLGEHWGMLYPEGDLRRIREEVLPAVKETGNWHGTTTGLRADGSTFVEDHALATTDGEKLICTVRDATERRKRERELEETRARFRALTTNATHAVLTIDEESRVRYASDAITGILGYTPEELTGESLLTVVPERFRDDHREAVSRYLREGTKRLEWDWVELPGLHRDGHEVPLGISFGEATVDGESRFTAIVRDITERKERERELERTRDLLERTERIADVGGWEVDAATEEVFWTEHLFELLGVEGDEEPPLAEALDVYHEDDRPVVERAVESALDAGESFDVEARFRRADGEVRWLQIQGDPTVEGDDVVGVRGAVQDITDRRRRERVLREMYDIISTPGRSFDEQVRALLELGREELDTQYGTLSEIRGDDYVFDVVVADDDSIQSGDVVPLEATNCEVVASTERTLVLGNVERDAPGQTHRAGFAEWGIACYIGAPVFVDGEVHGTFCFYGTEARPGQFSEWEETLVDLMSRWVSYELQRRQTETRLSEQNERLERFASVVSHDLRNPLTVASGRLEMAREECASDHLDDVAAAHERMRTLIDDLLALAREGEQLDETEGIDLSDLVERCHRTVDTGTATVDVDVDRTVRADRSRLQQLLENLLYNAVEHGGEGVTVTVGDLADGFYVEDDGPGVPPDEREDAFEAGYSTEGGSGFGLNIVARVVDAHGWTVRLTESDAGGARFEITGVEFVEE